MTSRTTASTRGCSGRCSFSAMAVGRGAKGAGRHADRRAVEGMWKNQGMRPKIRIGLVQMTCSEDPRRTWKKRWRASGKRRARGTDCVFTGAVPIAILLPEEDATQFELAEAIPGPSTETMGKIARETGTVVVASVFERRAAGVYHNTAAVLNADGTLVGIYRKMHIPDDPLYYEKFYFTPGDLGFRNFETAYGRIGVLVCWDQWYPERRG